MNTTTESLLAGQTGAIELEGILKPVITRATMKGLVYGGLGIIELKNIPIPEILKSTDLLVGVYKNRPASFIMELYFNAKADEYVNIFSKAPPDEKAKIVETLTTVNPSNSTKYFKIQGN